MLKEPELKMKKSKELRRESEGETARSSNSNPSSQSTDACLDMSLSEKVQYLTSRVAELVMSDIKYPLCFLGVMVSKLVTILYSIYLMLWMTSFVPTGVVESDERVKTLYSEVLTGAMVGTLIAMPFFGKIADTAPIGVFLPIAFLMRGAIAYQFQFIKDPESTMSVLLSMLIIVASAVQFISVEVLYLRSLPSDIRGVMIGLSNFFGLLG